MSCRQACEVFQSSCTSWSSKIIDVGRTENSHRQFCTACGAPVLVGHPSLGMTDVPAGSIQGFTYRPTLHVHYGEKVMAVRDGLPKFKDFPRDFGGSGDTLTE